MPSIKAVDQQAGSSLMVEDSRQTLSQGICNLKNSFLILFIWMSRYKRAGKQAPFVKEANSERQTQRAQRDLEVPNFEPQSFKRLPENLDSKISSEDWESRESEFPSGIPRIHQMIRASC